MTFVPGAQTCGIATRSLRTGTRILKIRDGEDVGVLRRPQLFLLVRLRVSGEGIFHLKKENFDGIWLCKDFKLELW